MVPFLKHTDTVTPTNEDIADLYEFPYPLR